MTKSRIAVALAGLALLGLPASGASAATTVDTQPPSAPTDFCVEQDGTLRTFRWSASTDNVDAPSQISYELWDPMFYKGVPVAIVVGVTEAGPFNFGGISVINAKDRAGNRSEFVGLFDTC